VCHPAAFYRNGTGRQRKADNGDAGGRTLAGRIRCQAIRGIARLYKITERRTLEWVQERFVGLRHRFGHEYAPRAAM
jgi:hypothetical protein